MGRLIFAGLPILHQFLRNMLVEDFLRGQGDDDFVAALEERFDFLQRIRRIIERHQKAFLAILAHHHGFKGVYVGTANLVLLFDLDGIPAFFKAKLAFLCFARGGAGTHGEDAAIHAHVTHLHLVGDATEGDDGPVLKFGSSTFIMGNNCQERSTGTDCHLAANGKKASRAAMTTVGFLRRDSWAGLTKKLINIDEYNSLVFAWTTMVASAGHHMNGLAGAVTVQCNDRRAPVHDHFLPTINVEEAVCFSLVIMVGLVFLNSYRVGWFLNWDIPGL